MKNNYNIDNSERIEEVKGKISELAIVLGFSRNLDQWKREKYEKEIDELHEELEKLTRDVQRIKI